jgi:hypothetical protein
VKALLAFCAVLASGVPALAVDLHCVGPADLEIPVFVDVTLNEAGEAENAMFEIQGDMSYTTIAEQEANRSTIVPVSSDSEHVRFKLHYAYQDYDSDVAEIWLVKLWEVSQSATGGVLSVAGGGVWPLACTETS